MLLHDVSCNESKIGPAKMREEDCQPMSTDFVKAVDEEKTFKQQFVLNYKDWALASVAPTLTWKRIKFDATSTTSIPKAAGVYAFMIGSENPCLPAFSYLIYIGIAGYKTGSPRTLQDRYRNYLKEQVELIRPMMHYFLSKYKDSMYFYFAEVDKSVHSLVKIEKELNDKLKPPGNENDYSAGIRPKVKAVWK